MSFSFELFKERGAARLGRLRTPHGVVETPAFVAVGTQAAVKTLTPQETREVGTQVIFANTYHLYLRPGEDVVAEAGGVHRFMGWDAPVMTDSGGFQVFSLGAGLEHGVGKVANIFPGEAGGVLTGRRAASRAPLMTVSEEEVRFKSHLDGSAHVFTPEKSIAVQRALGADMILAFDECTSPLHDEAYTAKSAARTHRWAERSLGYFRENGPRHGYEQALYGIVQGGLSRRCARRARASSPGWRLTGWRSAATSARRKTTCAGFWSGRHRCCRRGARATSWASVRWPISSTGSSAAVTPSTA